MGLDNSYGARLGIDILFVRVRLVALTPVRNYSVGRSKPVPTRQLGIPAFGDGCSRIAPLNCGVFRLL